MSNCGQSFKFLFNYFSSLLLFRLLSLKRLGYIRGSLSQGGLESNSALHCLRYLGLWRKCHFLTLRLFNLVLSNLGPGEILGSTDLGFNQVITMDGRWHRNLCKKKRRDKIKTSVLVRTTSDFKNMQNVIFFPHQSPEGRLLTGVKI